VEPNHVKAVENDVCGTVQDAKEGRDPIDHSHNGDVGLIRHVVAKHEPRGEKGHQEADTIGQLQAAPRHAKLVHKPVNVKKWRAEHIHEEYSTVVVEEWAKRKNEHSKARQAMEDETKAEFVDVLDGGAGVPEKIAAGDCIHVAGILVIAENLVFHELAVRQHDGTANDDYEGMNHGNDMDVPVEAFGAHKIGIGFWKKEGADNTRSGDNKHACKG